MHEDQLDVHVGLVRRLVADRFPRWAALPVTPVASTGTMNAMFRLGDALAVRVPIRGEPAATRADLEREADAARELTGRLPVPVPAPAALAPPGDGFPLPWAVQGWLPGTIADGRGSPGLAGDLAALITALRRIPTRGRRFTGDYRGGLLADHDPWVRESLERSAGLVDVVAAGALWDRLVDLARPAEDAMCHGDLIPSNLLVDGDGRLAGLLDLAVYGPADPALDLVCAWHCLEPAPRRALREAVGGDDLEWARGQAWALEQSIGLAWYYARSNPAASALGRRTLARILAEPVRP